MRVQSADPCQESNDHTYGRKGNVPTADKFAVFTSSRKENAITSSQGLSMHTPYGFEDAAHLGFLAADRVQKETAFAKDVFRFLQLCCEGHKQDFQNYLRTQPGANTPANLVTCSVDYLLRLQEALKDLLGYYNSAIRLDSLGSTILGCGANLAIQVWILLDSDEYYWCISNSVCIVFVLLPL